MVTVILRAKTITITKKTWPKKRQGHLNGTPENIYLTQKY